MLDFWRVLPDGVALRLVTQQFFQEDQICVLELQDLSPEYLSDSVDIEIGLERIPKGVEQDPALPVAMRFCRRLLKLLVAVKYVVNGGPVRRLFIFLVPILLHQDHLMELLSELSLRLDVLGVGQQLGECGLQAKQCIDRIDGIPRRCSPGEFEGSDCVGEDRCGEGCGRGFHGGAQLGSALAPAQAVVGSPQSPRRGDPSSPPSPPRSAFGEDRPALAANDD